MYGTWWFDLGILACVIISSWYITTTFCSEIRLYFMRMRKRHIEREIQKWLRNHREVESLYTEIEEPF